MDRLEHMLTIQQTLNETIRQKRNLTDITPTVWIQKYTLAMLSELAEMLDEVNFKWWKNPKKLDEAALKEELVDVLHFFLSIAWRPGWMLKKCTESTWTKTPKILHARKGKAKNPATKSPDRYLKS